MFRNRPGWKPVPYSDDEKEFMAEQERERRQFLTDTFAEEEAQKVMEWRGSNGRPVSIHFDPRDRTIYFKVLFSRQDHDYNVSSLRRPTAEEKRSNPDVYAVLDNGEQRRGLTRERYMALRAKLEEK